MLNKKMLSLIFCVASFSLSATVAPTKEQLEQYKKDGTLQAKIDRAKKSSRQTYHPELIRRLNENQHLHKHSQSRGHNAQISPLDGYVKSTGKVNMLVLLVEFQDHLHSEELNSRSAIEDKIFGDGNADEMPMDSLRNYYLRSSYNKLDFQGHVLDWYQTEYNRPTDADLIDENGNYVNIDGKIIKDALAYHVAQGHDLTQYDNDGDGDIDYLAVIWAGPRGEWGSLWWGSALNFQNSNFDVDGMSLDQVAWQAVSEYDNEAAFSPQTLIHETGHALGLPDLYEFSSSSNLRGGVGWLDVMGASANYDHNSFSKYILGWLKPQVISGSEQQINLLPVSESGHALLLAKDATEQTKWDEFYIAEYRKEQLNDSRFFPRDGLVIWHVDARVDEFGNLINDNNYSDNKLIRLVQADGLDELERFGGNAQKDDIFHTGDEFSASKKPYSRLNNGEFSGVVIDDIQVTDESIKLTAKVMDTVPEFSVSGIADLDKISSGHKITITPTDDTFDVETVEVYVDNTLVQRFSQAPYELTFNNELIETGTHTLKLKMSTPQSGESAQEFRITYLNETKPYLFVNFAAEPDKKLMEMLDESGLEYTYVEDHLMPLSVEEFPVVHLYFGWRYLAYTEANRLDHSYEESIDLRLTPEEVTILENYLISGGQLLVEGERGLEHLRTLIFTIGVVKPIGAIEVGKAYSNALSFEKTIEADLPVDKYYMRVDFLDSEWGQEHTNIMTAVGTDDYDNIEGTCVLSKTFPEHEGKVIIAQCITEYFAKREDKANLFNTYLDFFEIGTQLKGNTLPQASAGAAQTVAEETTVNLSAAASDVDEDELTYAWKQLTGPQITLINETTLTPSFIAPEVTEDREVSLQLTVSDGVAEVTSQVTITVQHVNKSPVLTVGSDQTVKEGDTVTLVATATDADGSELSIQWTQTSGIQVTLTGEQTLSPSFTAPEVSQNETLTFEVSVSDGEASVSNVIRITVQDSSVVTPTPNTSTGNTSSGTNTGNTSSATPSSSSGGSGGGSLGGYLLGLLSLMVVAQRRRRSV